jgi:hypothetical protein
MRLKLLTLIFFLTVKLAAQSSYILDNIFELNLKFKMHQDSLTNLFEVDCKKELFDSTIVRAGDRVLNFDRIFKDQILDECQYPGGQVQTYLYSRHLSDSFYVFLDFVRSV